MRRILIVGATSAIAEAIARRFAAEHDSMYLVGRNAPKLEAISQDLRVRGAQRVESETLDANDFPQHAPMLERAGRALGGLDTVLIAHGTLPDQRACERSVDLTMVEMRTNALSVISLVTLTANVFESQRQGTIAVISSVAGDRGRAVNYVYGAAKAAVTTFLSGLRQRVRPAGVRVLTIKPGFVDTPMTKDFAKSALWATPEAIAADIASAIRRGKSVTYVPWFWRPIMAIIRTIPESVFARMRF
jgi:short-subunit dehydrogenase